jgi:hypothetical protein
MSFDYLIDHALKNVWCTPKQDMQTIVKPARLTPVNGVWNTAEVLWRTHKLPVPNDRFHVYQIGQLHPLLMGLFPSHGSWSTLASTCNQMKMIVDIYSSSGIQLPRIECWYMVTQDKNLILAVKEQPKIAFNLKTEELFLRVYSNAYFNSIRSDPLDDFIEVDGKIVKSVEDILLLQARYDVLATKPGAVYAFVNGMKVSGIDLFTAAVDDVVEYVYDSSIFLVQDFTVRDLLTFDSVLDVKHKYLLHYPGSNHGTINYHDDIDLFIMKNGTNGRSKGLYYHRNQEDAVRMVTHKDYAIPTNYVVGYAATQPDWVDPEQLIIRLHVRKSGYHRTLVDEANRIKELYKLPDDKLVQAMIGVNSTVPSWTAAALEDSFYGKIMRSSLLGVTRKMVQEGYGYNAISKVLGNTPSVIENINGNPGISVPHGLFRNSVAYEYDADGLLKGWNTHDIGSKYLSYDASANLVEMIAGIGGLSLDEYYGFYPITLDVKAEYRMYICHVYNGIPDNKWEDVTDSGMYARIDNKVTWLVDPLHYYPMVRSNKNILAYDLKLRALDGLLRFSFDTFQTRGGVTTMWVMQIPMGELDLWLNGHSLIEGVDYFVNFPEVVIVNKKYLKDVLTTEQRITVRFTGFCNSDLNLTRDVPKDKGYVEYGLLSHNNRFDIRDDKIMRIVVEGKTLHRGMLKFSESDAGVTVPNALNGAPYMLRDIVMPLRGTAVDDTYVLREASKLVDEQISDYLTLMKPEQIQSGPNTITQRYELFSPLCCKILYDLKNGDLNDPRIQQNYTDEDVVSICAPYEYLLKSDPTQEGLKLDDRYVVIHPHNLSTVIDVDLYQYKFLKRVIRLYLKDAVDISHFVRLSA